MKWNPVNLKRIMVTGVSWSWVLSPKDESEWKRKLKLASLCAYFPPYQIAFFYPRPGWKMDRRAGFEWTKEVGEHVSPWGFHDFARWQDMERPGNPGLGKLWCGFPASGWQQWAKSPGPTPGPGRGTQERRRKVVFNICIWHLEGNSLLQRDKPGLYIALIT